MYSESFVIVGRNEAQFWLYFLMPYKNNFQLKLLVEKIIFRRNLFEQDHLTRTSAGQEVNNFGSVEHHNLNCYSVPGE